MSSDKRNIDILRHIIQYCDEVDETHIHFSRSFQTFKSNVAYKNAIALCVLQIGELSGRLSDDFRQAYDGAPWKSIKGLRNIVAHQYGQIDVDVLWNTSTKRIQELKDYCVSIIEKQYVIRTTCK
ncbi:HepT-like ribonuclease domain-containing protein [Desulfitobacterium chlororespirans]|uniref:Uncharacterized conserved protein, contains HEPN domain n=1 Tax=Desulfitobacterium chlororespirans DSM 11544 TaxID=1121395 RepID=A0A1M7UY08_9FIRM|nr:HepT-like ribonuclease domain-containing protein [Desulfitobacterium chlororespirans]SHN87921.1 Uncharacterized conserved protein, contains HEPN domain [Desulfitobacterium chlororespirans DSM 11544]